MFLGSVHSISKFEQAYPKRLSRFLGENVPNLITLRGNPDLMLKPNGKIFAFICSAKSPASVLLAVQDLAHQWREQGQPIISGFHSLVEQEVLEVLLRGSSPIIICPARGISNMRLKPEWKEPMQDGRLLIISAFSDETKRPTKKIAHERNRFVAALADEILIAHAEPGSKTATLQEEILRWGKSILTLENIS